MGSLFKNIKRLIVTIIVLVVIVVAYFIVDGYNMYKTAIEEIPLAEKVAQIRLDKNYVQIEDVATDFKNAVIAVEDKRFYEHFGIDLYSIGRAFISNVENKKIIGGGSTITQQLAKNMYFEQKKKLSRKVAEVFMSLDLEENYEKDEILELYMNIIYFGDGYYGIKEATNGYLDKEPSELDLYESSLLAGIPNAPSVYELSNNSQYTYQRQAIVLNAMVENNYITQEQMNEALNTNNETENKNVE